MKRNGDTHDVDRALELRRMLVLTLGETAGFFIRLHADGRELTGQEQIEARSRLEAGAACLRAMAKEPEVMAFLAEQGKRFDLRAPVSALRRFQRSLILAMSTDSERRRRAGTSADHTVLLRTVLDRLGLMPQL